MSSQEAMEKAVKVCEQLEACFEQSGDVTATFPDRKTWNLWCEWREAR